MYNKKVLSALSFALLAFDYCSGASLYPRSLDTQSGTASSTSMSVLKAKDQNGSEDGWGKYVELYGSDAKYSGVFTFDVDSDASKVASYNLNVNFKGPKGSSQLWQFEYLDQSTNTWIAAGDNTDVPSWEWTALSFCGQTPFSSLVADGSLKLRLSSNIKYDDCDIDYLSITTVEGESAPATEAPATQKPSTAPTTRPSTAPTTRPVTEKPTERATEQPTERATQRPTEKATQRPTEKATQRPTEKATQRPTEKATQRPTEKATQRPTEKATQKPTEKATQKPTEKATQKPTSSPVTQKPTSSPATNPPSAPGGRICPAGKVWSPAPGTTWQWQLTGTIDQSKDVQMYDIDLFDATEQLISQLHSAGRVVICYFSTQYEDWRPDAKKFTSDILGANLDDWPGERYVDIRSAKLRQIMTERLDLALSKGCDGVEPDNVDGYSNSNGLGLKAADQIEYNKFLASESHKRGLSVGLKNDLDQVAALVPFFDWALNEQCNEYGECNYLTPFITAGKAVFGVEYSGSSSSVCSKMETAKMSWLMKDLDLGAKGTACCASSGCKKAAYTCVSYSSKREIDDETASVVLEDNIDELAEVAEVAPQTFDSASSTIVSSALAVFSFAAAVMMVL